MLPINKNRQEGHLQIYLVKCTEKLFKNCSLQKLIYWVRIQNRIFLFTRISDLFLFIWILITNNKPDLLFK